MRDRLLLVAGASVASLAALITCLAGCSERPIGVTSAAKTGVATSGAAGTATIATGAAGTGGLVNGTAGTAGPVFGSAGTGGAPRAPGWLSDPAICVGVPGPDTQTATTSCRATCEMPAGETTPVPSLDAAYTAMQGRWKFCDDGWLAAIAAPSNTVGVEFGPASREPTANGSTVGGTMYYLVQGSSGAERGHGDAYQLSYDISPEGGSAYQINIHPAPNSGFWIRLRHSPCPDELEVTVFYASSPTRLIRFPACPTGGADASSPAADGVVTPDGVACSYMGLRGVLHYERPGCGAAEPEPVCGHVGMLGCYAGYHCNCDGTIRGVCESWSEKPWAYFVPYTPNMPAITSCDPNHPPAIDAGGQ